MTATTPESHGIPSAAVLDLLDDLEQPGLDPHGLVIHRHGVPVVRGTWAPYRPEVPALVYSVSKTFTSIAVGHLVAEGRLSVDDLAAKVLGVTDPTGITVRHLLTMNTGHSAEQLPAVGFDSARLLGTVPEHAPGSRFVYSSPASMVLSSIVTTLTGERLTDYLRPRLLDPLGIADAWWTPHRDEGPEGGLDIDQGFSGLHLTAEDVARLAVAMADGGRYGGAQVIPAGWVAEMARTWSDNDLDPDAHPDWRAGYGYQVWRNDRWGFRADGAYGQFGLAVPERGLAVGYLGATRTTDRVLDAFRRFADRLSDGPLPPDPAGQETLDARLAALDTWPGRTGPGRMEPDPEPTPSDVVSPVPWTLVSREPGACTLAVGDDVLVAAEDSWTTHVLAWPHRPDEPGEAGGARGARDDVLVLAVRARTADDGSTEVHAVVPTSPHGLVARGRPGERLDLAWVTTPLWRPSLSTLAVPRGYRLPGVRTETIPDS